MYKRQTYEQALETLGNMGSVVDALYLKANLLAAPPKPKDDKKDGDKKDGDKKGKEEEKVMVKKKGDKDKK